MSDMNLNNPGFQIQTGNQNFKITGKNIMETLGNIAAPVFDFLTKKDEEAEQKMVTTEMIDAEMLKYAKMQNILGGEEHKINMVW